jgi:hypothetical protein
MRSDPSAKNASAMLSPYLASLSSMPLAAEKSSGVLDAYLMSSYLLKTQVFAGSYHSTGATVRIRASRSALATS